MGTLQGGILCDVADAAMGMAFVTTLAPDESFTTMSLAINFFRPVWAARLRFDARVVNRSKNNGYIECDIADPHGNESRRPSPPAPCYAANRQGFADAFRLPLACPPPRSCVAAATLQPSFCRLTTPHSVRNSAVASLTQKADETLLARPTDSD
jgi:hypothetical protein